MKLKILICMLLVISLIASVCSCRSGPLDYLEKTLAKYVIDIDEYKDNGVTYELHRENGEKFYYVEYISSTGNNSPLYIPDEINGIPVTGLGLSAFMMNYSLTISGVEKVYFPWSISYSPQQNIEYTSEVKYIISASSVTLIDDHYYPIFVIPISLYLEYITSPKTKENVIPANVTYLFNYDNVSNNGYFFIDLIEESGHLMKPPYDPKREGYVFAGWYTEENCTNEWNFDIDEVTIEYDENGERIYEEIKLYAKWELNS